jgi:PAS domain S-box-containing protein
MTQNLTRLVEGYGAGEQVSSAFLQGVIDAFPDSLMVIDRDYRIVLANRAAEKLFGAVDPASDCIRCFQYSHRLSHPCEGEDHHCPLREVIATKAAVRVHHTHYDADGKEISVAIDAAPVVDERGEVVQIIESCRDVTEQMLSRRVLRIGNRYMAMKPMLQEAAEALRGFAGCAVAGIRILDESDGITVCSENCFCQTPSEPAGRHGPPGDSCCCLKILNRQTLEQLPSVMRGESLYADCKTMFLPTIPDEERSRLGDACDSCGSESLALVPISINGHNLGLIHISYPRRNAISRTGVEALERLAIELGTTIERVRAEEALRAAHDELEMRVQQRTADLTAANWNLQAEIAQRTRLEREILDVTVNEQQRIGQELHDGVGQELTGLCYLAHSLHQRLEEDGSGEAAETAAELARNVPHVLGQIRKVVKGLIPLEFGAGDLESALEVLVTNVAGQTGISCRFRSSGQPRVCDDDVAIQIYRIAQEAVANAVKHSGARQIVVSLEAEPGQLRLAVQDDGGGIRSDATESTGHGLRTMKYRACVIGGSLEVRPMADGGTLVACVLPQKSCQSPDGEDSSK